MSDPDPIKLAWKASNIDAALPDMEMVRSGADKFYRQIRRRNAMEYIACAIVIVWFSAYAWLLPSAAARAGAAMVAVGSLIVAWQLRRLASVVPPPDRAAAEPILVHQRAQLARQRDALSSVFTWYLLPLIPGMLVMCFSHVLDHGAKAWLYVTRSDFIGLIPFVAVFTAVWLLNQRAARRLQKQIDNLEALIGRDG